MSTDPIGAWFTLPDGTTLAAYGVHPSLQWNGWPVALMTRRQLDRARERLGPTPAQHIGAGLYTVDGLTWTVEPAGTAG